MTLDDYSSKSMNAYEYHPIANLFPMGTENELKELAATIGANGLEVPIFCSNGKTMMAP